MVVYYCYLFGGDKWDERDGFDGSCGCVLR